MVRRLECRYPGMSPSEHLPREARKRLWCQSLPEFRDVSCVGLWDRRQSRQDGAKFLRGLREDGLPDVLHVFVELQSAFSEVPRIHVDTIWHYLKCFFNTIWQYLTIFDLFFNVLMAGDPWSCPSRSLEIEWLLKMKKAPLVKSSAHPHTARNARNHIWTYLKLGREASCWCAEKSDAKLRILEVYLQLGHGLVRCCFCSHSCPVALLLLSSIQSLWHRVGRNDYRLRLFTILYWLSL